MENEFDNLEPQNEPSHDETNQQGLLPDGELDHEGAMAKADLFKLGKYSYKLFKKLEDDTQLESWVQAKITKAADYLASVYHYLEFEMKFNDYAHKLDNSDMLSEGHKAVMKDKLNEAKAKIKELKIAEAKKTTSGKQSDQDPVAKNMNKFNKATVEPNKKKESKKRGPEADLGEAVGKVMFKGRRVGDWDGRANKFTSTDPEHESGDILPRGALVDRTDPFSDEERGKKTKHRGNDLSWEESQLNELGKKTINSYVEKSLDSFADTNTRIAKRRGKPQDGRITGNLATDVETVRRRKNGLNRVTGGHPNDMKNLKDLEANSTALASASKKDKPILNREIGTDKARILTRSKGTKVHGDMYEAEKPSAGLSKAKKSAVVKDAKPEKANGKPVKKFDSVTKKAGGEKPASAMWKNIKENAERQGDLKEGFFSDSPEEMAASNSSMAELLAFRAQYQGTKWANQIEYRINRLKNDIELGDAPVGPDGNPIKALPPEEWERQNPTEVKNYQEAIETVSPSENEMTLNESTELNRMKEFLTRLNG